MRAGRRRADARPHGALVTARVAADALEGGALLMRQLIRNVRPLGAPPVDVVLDGARIGALVPAGSAPGDLPCLLDGEGRLLLSAPVESHVHFDKTLWATPWRPNTAGPARLDK